MVIEPIINTHKIKYEILTPLIDSVFTHGEKINIYINLDSILDKFYVKGIIEGIRDFRSVEYLALSSEIINILAHYRHFFWSRYYIKSKIFIYYTRKRPVYNCKFIPEYMLHNIDRKSINNPTFGTLNSFIDDNIKLIKLIITYIGDCYFIETDGLEPSIVPYYMIKKFENDKDLAHLILSKDLIDFQLLSSVENIAVLRLKYDDSYMITKNNIYDVICSSKKAKYRPSTNISIDLYPIILAHSGVKNRSVTGVEGYGFIPTIKKIENGLLCGKIINTYYHNIEPVLNVIGSDIHKDKVINNYKAIDLRYQFKYLSPLDIDSIDGQIIDKYDNDSLMKLNSQYYRLNPIDIIRLVEGVDHIGSTKRKFSW